MDMKKFNYFIERVYYWVSYFGLYNWRITVHLDEDSEENDLAYTTFVVSNKRADIFLCADWQDIEMTDIELDRTAFHEVTEVLLLKIRYLAGKRTYNSDEIDGEIHSIISILTEKIFEKSKQ